MSEEFLGLAVCAIAVVVGGTARAAPPTAGPVATSAVGVPISSALPVLVNRPFQQERRLIEYTAPASVFCGGTMTSSRTALDVDPTITYVTTKPSPDFSNAQPSPPPPIVEPTFAYSFDIDANGWVRNLQSVSRLERTYTPHQPYVRNDQIEPAIAAWRFQAGAPRSGCSLTVQAHVLSFADAGPQRLLRAFALRVVGPADKDWREAAIPGSDCYTGERLAERVQHFVAVDEMKEPAGSRSWSVVVFDVGADGHTRNLKVAASSGRSDLDAAALAAQRQSTYARRARVGCVLRYYTTPGTVSLTAPARRNTPSLDCPLDPRLTFSFTPHFPPAFQSRSIEGYALVQYDTAPWGQVGAVKVLASQPAEAFGKNAEASIQSARAPSSDVGSKGCLMPMIFRIDGSRTQGAYEAPKPSRDLEVRPAGQNGGAESSVSTDLP